MPSPSRALISATEIDRRWGAAFDAADLELDSLEIPGGRATAERNAIAREALGETGNVTPSLDAVLHRERLNLARARRLKEKGKPFAHLL